MGWACGDEPKDWADGEICEPWKSCDRCASGFSSYWWTQGFERCGEEEKLQFGELCLPGTTCNACADGRSQYWWTKLHDACGYEPEWVEGTPCLVGTSCERCVGGALNNSWGWSCFKCCVGDGYDQHCPDTCRS